VYTYLIAKQFGVDTASQNLEKYSSKLEIVGGLTLLPKYSVSSLIT